MALYSFEIELQPGQPLRLNAQHHHRLRLAQRRIEVALDLDAGPSLRRQLRQQLLRSAEQHARAQPRQQQHVRARYAAVQNVADDGHRDARQGFGVDSLNARPQMRQNRAQIEQRLRGMLVHAVAGVEHRQARRLPRAATARPRSCGAG